MGFVYSLPTQVLWGTIADLEPLVRGRRTFVIRGQQTLSRPPLDTAFPLIVKDVLHKLSTPVGQNPTFAEVRTLVAEINSFSPDLIVAIGGGSPIDAAKAASLVASNGGDPRDYYIGGQPPKVTPIPLIAIPTTAGTGTEVTPYAILVDETAQQKHSYLAGKLFPETALLDPDLTQSMSAYVAACTGMDALCHAVESIWARRASGVTIALAREALSIIVRSYAAAVDGDRPARSDMLHASMLAGMAFANSGVTAIHPASYPLTTLCGIPHGHACGMFLLPFIAFNWPSLDTEKQVLLDAAGCTDLGGFLACMRTLLADGGLETGFSAMGITGGDAARIAERAIGGSTLNNPRPVSPEDIEHMIRVNQ